MTNKEIINSAVASYTEKVSDGTVVKFVIESIDFSPLDNTHYAAIFHKGENVWFVTQSHSYELRTSYNYGEFMEFLASDGIVNIEVFN